VYQAGFAQPQPMQQQQQQQQQQYQQQPAFAAPQSMCAPCFASLFFCSVAFSPVPHCVSQKTPVSEARLSMLCSVAFSPVPHCVSQKTPVSQARLSLLIASSLFLPIPCPAVTRPLSPHTRYAPQPAAPTPMASTPAAPTSYQPQPTAAAAYQPQQQVRQPRPNPSRLWLSL
jgi:hypothetical protein